MGVGEGELEGAKHVGKNNLLLLWTVVGGRVGYQAWQEFCCVWLELVCHKCLGQSGIWTSFDGELCSIKLNMQEKTCLQLSA